MKLFKVAYLAKGSPIKRTGYQWAGSPASAAGRFATNPPAGEEKVIVLFAVEAGEEIAGEVAQ